MRYDKNDRKFQKNGVKYPKVFKQRDVHSKHVKLAAQRPHVAQNEYILWPR